MTRRDGVGTVGRRGTAGDDFDALHGSRRNRVDVDHARGVARRTATTVDQDEVAVGAEPAEPSTVAAPGVLVAVGWMSPPAIGVCAGVNCGSLLRFCFERRRAGVLEVGLVIDRHHRAVGFEVLALNARTGDDDRGVVILIWRHRPVRTPESKAQSRLRFPREAGP